MLFSTSALLAVAATPLLVLAQGSNDSNGSNPFNIPPESLNTEAGESVDLTWEPTTEGTVTILLRSGASNALNEGTAIASGIDNSGSFTWQVPDDIVRGSNYALEIVDDDNEENTNYTPPFVIESDNNAAPSSSDSSSSSSASATESSSTASETETDTESATETTETMTSTDASSSPTAAASVSATNSSNSTASMTTSTNSRTSSAATGTSTSDPSEDSAIEASEGGAARTTTFVGLLGLVALGAFAL